MILRFFVFKVTENPVPKWASKKTACAFSFNTTEPAVSSCCPSTFTEISASDSTELSCLQTSNFEKCEVDMRQADVAVAGNLKCIVNVDLLTLLLEIISFFEFLNIKSDVGRIQFSSDSKVTKALSCVTVTSNFSKSMTFPSNVILEAF